MRCDLKIHGLACAINVPPKCSAISLVPSVNTSNPKRNPRCNIILVYITRIFGEPADLILA
jgi:hypothetical protein